MIYFIKSYEAIYFNKLEWSLFGRLKFFKYPKFYLINMLGSRIQ